MILRKKKCTYLSNMIVERSHNAAVNIGNKIFVIGGYFTSSCENLDSFSGIFTTMQSDIKQPAIKYWYFEAFGVGNNIVVFHHHMYISNNSIDYLYDAKEEKLNKKILKWLNIDFKFSNQLFYLSIPPY